MPIKSFCRFQEKDELVPEEKMPQESLNKFALHDRLNYCDQKRKTNCNPEVGCIQLSVIKTSKDRNLAMEKFDISYNNFYETTYQAIIVSKGRILKTLTTRKTGFSLQQEVVPVDTKLASTMSDL